MHSIDFRTLCKPAIGFVAAALLAAPAFAMEANQKVEREYVVTQDDGTQVTRREAADKVRPGERVVYTIDYRNTQSEPASDLVFAMPVPGEIRYLEGSADAAGTRVEYSADGGQTYADRLSLTVVEAGAQRAASADDITHVRWTLLGELAPGDSGAISFKGRLR